MPMPPSRRRAAFPAWAALAPNERRTRLAQGRRAMQARSGEFIAAAGETGAMANWYGFNVRLAANMLREAAAMTTQITGEVIPSDVPGSFAMAVRQPCGVVLGIAPWNAPVILATRAIAMPLACGNTVVLKASELSPAVHRLIGQVLQDAGLGDGVVNVISNAPQDAAAIVARLIANPAVRRVNFTGSTHVGGSSATLGAPPQAGLAGTGRQGAVAGARRRRPRRGGRRRVWRVLQPGADLHVDRARDRRRQGRRCVRRQAGRQGRDPARG
jgi:acyl-CoA reductase-like NAD-dependent aldehyde dehydrogenase